MSDTEFFDTMCEGDYYDVTPCNGSFKVEVFGGAGLVACLPAKTEKQAHFIAKAQHPEAVTMREHMKILDKHYYSAEGRAYRAKSQQ